MKEKLEEIKEAHDWKLCDIEPTLCDIVEHIASKWCNAGGGDWAE